MDYNERIAALSDRFKTEFETLSFDQINTNDIPKAWTINQILHHLIKFNRSYFNIFEAIGNGKFATPLIGNFRFYANIIGNNILKSVSPNSTKKIKTAPMWRPEMTFSESQLPIFFDVNKEMMEHIGKMDRWIKRDIVIHSPISKSLVYPINTALEIIITHEEWHLKQALKIKEKISN